MVVGKRNPYATDPCVPAGRDVADANGGHCPGFRISDACGKDIRPILLEHESGIALADRVVVLSQGFLIFFHLAGEHVLAGEHFEAAYGRRFGKRKRVQRFNGIGFQVDERLLEGSLQAHARQPSSAAEPRAAWAM